LEQGAADGKRLGPTEGWKLTALRRFLDRLERLKNKKSPAEAGRDHYYRSLSVEVGRLVAGGFTKRTKSAANA